MRALYPAQDVVDGALSYGIPVASSLVLITSTLGTYCYRAVRVFPSLTLRSAEERWGKTRLLTLLARLAFKSPKRLAALLNPLGLFANSKKVRGRVLRAYELTPDRLADLRARYVPPSLAAEESE